MSYINDYLDYGDKTSEIVPEAFEQKEREEKHFYFDKNWFVFPFAVVWKTDIYELVGKHSRLEIHFLWWHWRWTFKRKEIRDEQINYDGRQIRNRLF